MNSESRARAMTRAIIKPFVWAWRTLTLVGKTALGFVVFAAATIVFLNVAFHSPVNRAYRALDPQAQACRAGLDDVLARAYNDEWLAVEQAGDAQASAAREKSLHCAIQSHRLDGYQPRDASGAPTGAPKPLLYDLAFLEFQENGDPYMLCADADYDAGRCDGQTAATSTQAEGQLEALVAKLAARPGEPQKNFVVAFIHGWRHNAQIGDGNVSDLRVYAAHAARFVAERCDAGDARFCGMNVTGVFIGWRGARVDEMAITRGLSGVANYFCGENPCFLKNLPDAVNTVAAALTLFDRKPVSEAVAPAAYAALQRIENAIGLQNAQRDADLAPCEHVDLLRAAAPCFAHGDVASTPQARMVVFGHSLGGNMLATALQDELIKLVDNHRPGHCKAADCSADPGDFLPAPLGNLTVLINPAGEAEKWTKVQREVWRRIEMSLSDKAHGQALVDGHGFFRDDQRPVVISATAARDWPPGGMRPADCAGFLSSLAGADPQRDRADLQKSLDAGDDLFKRAVNYDWATYDLFPAFRMDFRPISSSIDRAALRLSDQSSGACAPQVFKGPASAALHALASALRVLPFMNTDIEQTRTIGNLDPPRPPHESARTLHFTGRPFGTTHELRGWDAKVTAVRKTGKDENGKDQEQTVDYAQIASGDAACPPVHGWLGAARRLRASKPDSGGHATFWDAQELPPNGRPALRFTHGFQLAGLAAITRANDPFWNMRAFDNALAEHDGYMLSSFICAMQQLALDDITPLPPTPAK